MKELQAIFLLHPFGFSTLATLNKFKLLDCGPAVGDLSVMPHFCGRWTLSVASLNSKLEETFPRHYKKI